MTTNKCWNCIAGPVNDHRSRGHAVEKDTQRWIRCHPRRRKVETFLRRQGILLSIFFSLSIFLCQTNLYWSTPTLFVTLHWGGRVNTVSASDSFHFICVFVCSFFIADIVSSSSGMLEQVKQRWSHNLWHRNICTHTTQASVSSKNGRRLLFLSFLNFSFEVFFSFVHIVNKHLFQTGKALDGNDIERFSNFFSSIEAQAHIGFSPVLMPFKLTISRGAPFAWIHRSIYNNWNWKSHWPF